MALRKNTLTNTLETGTYYAGKNKASQAYGKVLSGQASGGAPRTGNEAALMMKNQANAAAAKARMATPNPIEEAAVATAERELQDELAQDNRDQAARTFSFAQQMATRPRTPGGSIQRGGDVMSIGSATGSGLAKANADAKRKARLAEAKAKAKLTSATISADRVQQYNPTGFSRIASGIQGRM